MPADTVQLAIHENESTYGGIRVGGFQQGLRAALARLTGGFA